MFKRFINEHIYCGLDVGSQKIKAAVLKVKAPGDYQLIGAYEQRIHGFKDGSVSDLGELSECIHHTLSELSKKTGIKLKEVQLGIDGNLVDARETSTAIPLIDRGHKVIAKRDIKKLNEQARLLGIKVEEEVLHDLPISYSVDDNNSALNPIGLYGRKLGVKSMMFIANNDRVKNITRAVHQAGYDVGHMFFGSYVSSEIILDQADKVGGCALVDIGSKVTSVLIFQEGLLKYFEKIPFGGDDFTHSIAREINLTFDLAEEIKKSYATTTNAQHLEEEILVKRDNSYIPIKRELIYHAIEPQTQFIVKGIQTVLDNSGLYDRMNNGIKLVGGGSLLSGLIERIEKQTNIAVTLGQINLLSQRNLINAAVFANVIGLAQNGFKQSIGYTLSSNGQAQWYENLSQKVKELYQEYF